MIDIDEYIEMWEHDLLGSNGVADLMDALIAEVKRLREVVDKQQMQYVSLETAYYNSPSEIENKRLRELLVEAAHCIHEMEGMAYAEADPDDLAKHAMEFRGNVSTTIGADAPWSDES